MQIGLGVHEPVVKLYADCALLNDVPRKAYIVPLARLISVVTVNLPGTQDLRARIMQRN